MLAQPGAEVAASPLWAKPLIAGDALAWYIEKLVWPVRLAALYPRSISKMLVNREIWAAWVLPMTLAIIAWATFRRMRWPAAAFLLFVVALLPVLGFVPSFYQRFSIVADRYVYVAMLGPALALAFVLGSPRISGSPLLCRGLAIVCVAGLAALGILSARQARYWHDTRTLFSRVLELDPSSDVACCNLAADAVALDQPAEAEQLARRAFKLNPGSANAGTTLADALVDLGRESEAGTILIKVTQQNPTNVEALTRLAGVLASTGHADQGVDFCRRALAVDPSFAPAHRSMAMLLSQEHQYAQAAAEAGEAVRLEPLAAVNHTVYGQALAALGRQREADQQFAAARALDPNSAAPPK
jgi:tetratricopeptide (TPR) repeat protein